MVCYRQDLCGSYWFTVAIACAGCEYSSTVTQDSLGAIATSRTCTMTVPAVHSLQLAVLIDKLADQVASCVMHMPVVCKYSHGI